MIFKEFLKGVVISQIFITTTLAHKYEIIMRDEYIFSPCDGVGYTYIDDYLDISNMTSETLANGSIYLNGVMKAIRDVGGTKNSVSIQSYKKTRDNWVSTIYNLGHKDACTYLFDKNQIWSSVLKYVPDEHRKCPFYNGQTLYLNVVTDVSILLPDPRFAGEYKVLIMVNFEELNEVFCVAMYADIYRV